MCDSSTDTNVKSLDVEFSGGSNGSLAHECSLLGRALQTDLPLPYGPEGNTRHVTVGSRVPGPLRVAMSGRQASWQLIIVSLWERGTVTSSLNSCVCGYKYLHSVFGLYHPLVFSIWVWPVTPLICLPVDVLSPYGNNPCQIAIANVTVHVTPPEL